MCNKHTESLSSRPPLMTSLPLRETTVTFILKIKLERPSSPKEKKKGKPCEFERILFKIQTEQEA